MRNHLKVYAFLLLSIFFIGCGHSQSTRVGLMSFGDLEGKTLPDNGESKIFEGEDCGHSYYLSNAVRDALNGTKYDTLVDVEVTNKTALFVFSNCINVKGRPIDSKTLIVSGAK